MPVMWIICLLFLVYQNFSPEVNCASWKFVDDSRCPGLPKPKCTGARCEFIIEQQALLRGWACLQKDVG
ncbi:hypothetical protein GE061_019009 [Apolygus lucorum]|uniref:Secreted protein n=1 Tax=Apolygus lucorum TaxID=248454 RepID=A0A8S9X9U7_APOLU|nr:hypothetical protein GE061_019009 [Apolygus lucorum]